MSWIWILLACVAGTVVLAAALAAIVIALLVLHGSKALREALRDVMRERDGRSAE